MSIRRVSDWSVVWDADGTPITFLSPGDLMERQVSTYERGLVDALALDSGAAGVVGARGNAKRQLEISRVDEVATVAAAWQAYMQALAADPWGLTSTLTITPGAEGDRIVRAALLDATHEVGLTAGVVEVIHRYKFRISRNTI